MRFFAATNKIRGQALLQTPFYCIASLVDVGLMIFVFVFIFSYFVSTFLHAPKKVRTKIGSILPADQFGGAHSFCSSLSNRPSLLPSSSFFSQTIWPENVSTKRMAKKHCYAGVVAATDRLQVPSTTVSATHRPSLSHISYSLLHTALQDHPFTPAYILHLNTMRLTYMSSMPVTTFTRLIILLLLQLRHNGCNSFFIIRPPGSTSAQMNYQHPFRQNKCFYTSPSMSLQYTLLTKHETHTSIPINTTEDLQATIQAIDSISLSLNKHQVMQLPANERYQYRIRQLMQFNATYGTFDLPYNYPNDTQLAKWAQSQRYEYTLYQKRKIGVKSFLTKERRQLLDYVGFPWNTTDKEGLTKRWMANFSILKEYKRLYSHVRVPENFICVDENLPDKEQVSVNLGVWVKNQRRNARIRPNDSKTRLRIEKLNEVGFIWDTKDEGNTIYDATWMRRYEELKQFRKERGNLHVPMNESREYDSLALWVRSQRSLYRQHNAFISHTSTDCTCNTKRIDLLNDIGFAWNGKTSLEQRRNEAWWDRFAELRVFYDAFGHLDIGTVNRGYCNGEGNNDASNTLNDRVDYNKLHRWTKTQRVRYKEWKQSNGTNMCLNRDKIKAMTELGFVWDKREERWQTQFQQLKAFGEKHSHYNVPTTIPSSDIALSYGQQQEGALSNQEDFWNQMTELGRWTRGQRVLFRKYKRGDNVSDRSRDLMQQLDDLGFLDLETSTCSEESISAAIGASPEEKKNIWDRYFVKLIAFQKKHGHCFISYRSDEDDMEQKRLYEWVAIQRRRYRIIVKKTNHGRSVAGIDLERFDKLKKLDFIFNVHEYKFQYNLNKLKEFHSRFGHSKVSPSHQGDSRLYNFVGRQRYLYRERMLKGEKNSLCDERIEKLSQLDFVWSPRNLE